MQNVDVLSDRITFINLDSIQYPHTRICYDEQMIVNTEQKWNERKDLSLP